MRWLVRAVWSAGISSLGVLACGAPPADRKGAATDFATVEVTMAPDAALSTADDGQERRAAPTLAGALPDGFPLDVPVYRPSSLVDQTIDPSGGSMLLFDSPDAVETVREAMSRRLRAEGWRAAAGGVWTKATRRLKLSVEARPSGSRFRLEI